MVPELSKKAYMGIWRFMIPIPKFMIKRDVKQMANAICRATVDVSEEERRVHRFVVTTMTDTNEPVTPEHISEKLDIPIDRVIVIVDKLEKLKVFFYRYDNEGINWAYPVTSESNNYKMTFNTGEQCTAA